MRVPLYSTQKFAKGRNESQGLLGLLRSASYFRIHVFVTFGTRMLADYGSI